MRAGLFAWALGLSLHFLPGFAPAWADDGELCRAAIAATERATFVPDRLMQAIGVIESGRRGASGVAVPWPWTINVEGAGEVFDSKPAAIAAVLAHQARGARSIDVGCMQINLMHHKAAFASLDQAFDPPTNARYAASFLLQLLAQTGSWPRAVAGYHSLTPEIGGEYAKKVMAVWARPELGRAAGPQLVAAAPARPAPTPGAIGGAAMPFTAGPIPSMPGSIGPQVITSTSGSTMPTLTGRRLDSYRAMPTRLAVGLFRRS